MTDLKDYLSVRKEREKAMDPDIKTLVQFFQDKLGAPAPPSKRIKVPQGTHIAVPNHNELSLNVQLNGVKLYQAVSAFPHLLGSVTNVRILKSGQKRSPSQQAVMSNTSATQVTQVSPGALLSWLTLCIGSQSS